jgi:CheY-like chemotaxis protein
LVEVVTSLSGKPSKGAAARLLVVDDDEACCYATGKILRDAGFEVVEASSFAPALAALERGARIDALVTDIRMEVHGFALARMARHRHPGLKVVYLTGFPEMLLPDEVGSDPALLKPVAPDALLRAVTQALGG